MPKHGGVIVAPEPLRQILNDTAAETLWLVVGAPEDLEFRQGSRFRLDLSLISYRRTGSSRNTMIEGLPTGV